MAACEAVDAGGNPVYVGDRVRITQPPLGVHVRLDAIGVVTLLPDEWSSTFIVQVNGFGCAVLGYEMEVLPSCLLLRCARRVENGATDVGGTGRQSTDSSAADAT